MSVHLLNCPLIVHNVESASIRNVKVYAYSRVLCCPLVLLEIRLKISYLFPQYSISLLFWENIVQSLIL